MPQASAPASPKSCRGLPHRRCERNYNSIHHDSLVPTGSVIGGYVGSGIGKISLLSSESRAIDHLPPLADHRTLRPRVRHCSRPDGRPSVSATPRSRFLACRQPRVPEGVHLPHRRLPATSASPTTRAQLAPSGSNRLQTPAAKRSTRASQALIHRDPCLTGTRLRGARGPHLGRLGEKANLGSRRSGHNNTFNDCPLVVE